MWFKGDLRMLVVSPNAVIRATLSSFDKPCDTGYKKYWNFNYCKLPSQPLCVCTRTHVRFSPLTLKMCLQSWWIKTLLESWWCSECKWAAEWDSRARGCLFIVFQKAIGFGCLQKQEDCTTFNHLLKVVLQMLNLGTEILLFHLSCKELSVSELQKTSPTDHL